MVLRPAESHENSCGAGWQPADRLPIGPGEPRSPCHVSHDDFQRNACPSHQPIRAATVRERGVLPRFSHDFSQLLSLTNLTCPKIVAS